MPEPWLKIGELAKRAGVSIPTIKHYLREGLIAPVHKSGRTMSWYDVTLVGRIRAIRELQQTRHLPLELIHDALAKNDAADDDVAAAAAISEVLSQHHGERSRSRDELIANGAIPQELDWLAALGLARPRGPEKTYSGDDLALLSTLGAARKSGLSVDMLPFAILEEYVAALRTLVEVELRMFRAGVLGRAHGTEVTRLTKVATSLSERLVVLLRRRLLLPTLNALIEEERHARATPPVPARRPRRVFGKRDRGPTRRAHQRKRRE